MLNNLLPEDIRILGYTEVPEDFNSRFSWKHREYKYFFDLGTKDLSKMKEASEKLLGQHNFRHFCKRDENKCKDGQEQNFERVMHEITFDPVFGDIQTDNPNPIFNMYVWTLKGKL